MQGFFDFVKSLGAARMAAMAAVTLALIGFFSFLMIQMTTPQMVPLFTDLSLEDSAAIIKDLERQAIPYQLKNDGAIVMVPKDKVARLRMKLAESGLPKGGGVGYEIFDKSDALGSTTFVQNINHLRALEGELARTIRSLDRVQAARVHLVLPDRPLFSRDKVDAIGVDRAQGARHAGAAAGARHPPSGGDRGQRHEARARFGDRRDRQAARRRRRAERSAGGRRRRRTQGGFRKAPARPGRDDRFLGGRPRPRAGGDQRRFRHQPHHPDVRQIRSRTAASCARARPARKARPPPTKRAGPVSVGNELPGAAKQAGRTSTGDQSRKTEEIVNYEISRTTKTEVTEAGRVNRISAAVLVDGIYTKNDKGEVTYQPRPKEEIDRIAALVRSAIGFDAKRGDQVEVVNLRFADTTPTPINEPTGWMSYVQFTKDDIMRVAEKGVMVLLGLVVLLMVVRPLVRRIISRMSTTAGGAAAVASAAGTAGVASAIGVAAIVTARRWRHSVANITSSGGPNISIVGADEEVAISNRTSAMIDIAKVQGRCTPSRCRRSARLAEKNPHEAVSIIRNWLHEDACLSHAVSHAERERQRRPSAGHRRLMADARQPSAGQQGRRKLTGPERAAVLMLALGEQYGAKIFSLLDDDELREISIVMSSLGTIEAEAVEQLLLEFVVAMSASGALLGNYDAAERLLQQYLPPERVGGIMDEIRGPAGRNMWEKLANVQEEVLANYLKNEYPQTVAVVLSKLRPEHAARVLAILPEDFSLDVVNRMLKMEAVQKEVIERVEQTLRTEFMSNLSQTRRRDAHEVMAEDLQQFRPPDRNALPHRAGSGQSATPPSASRR